MAQVVRTGWFKAVHVKSELSQELGALLTGRKLLVAELRDLDNGIRGLLRGFGLKVGQVSELTFPSRVRELVEEHAGLEALMAPLLQARDAVRTERERLHRLVLVAVRDDAVCRRLMTVPGVGPVTALTFCSAVDDPARFGRSRAVGAHFGLTPRRYQSGETDRVGHISKQGDGLARQALYEAANVLLTRTSKWSTLRHGAWRSPSAPACVAPRWPWRASWLSCCTGCGAPVPSFAGAGGGRGVTARAVSTKPAPEVPSRGRGRMRSQQAPCQHLLSPLARLTRPAFLTVACGGLVPTTNRRKAPAMRHRRPTVDQSDYRRAR